MLLILAVSLLFFSAILTLYLNRKTVIYIFTRIGNNVIGFKFKLYTVFFTIIEDAFGYINFTIYFNPCFAAESVIGLAILINYFRLFGIISVGFYF